MKICKYFLLSFVLIYNMSFAYPKPHAFPPFQIAGNLYYVGTDDLASYLIVTPEGNILINSNQESTVPMIKDSIEKLGFKYSDTKILLISHAHGDHAGGSALIKQQTGASYQVMMEDVANIESGGHSDFYYGKDPTTYFPATTVDKMLHDGDTVTLGNTTLTAHLTAGHTPGTTTWTLQVMDHGKPYNVVILGSLSVIPGSSLVLNQHYPDISKDFQHSFKLLKSLHADIFLGAHAAYFDLQKKYHALAKKNANPFIDPKGYKHYIHQQEKILHKALSKQMSIEPHARQLQE